VRSGAVAARARRTRRVRRYRRTCVPRRGLYAREWPHGDADELEAFNEDALAVVVLVIEARRREASTRRSHRRLSTASPRRRAWLASGQSRKLLAVATRSMAGRRGRRPRSLRGLLATQLLSFEVKE
jgi:hypothetical protein